MSILLLLLASQMMTTTTLVIISLNVYDFQWLNEQSSCFDNEVDSSNPSVSQHFTPDRLHLAALLFPDIMRIVISLLKKLMAVIQGRKCDLP